MTILFLMIVCSIELRTYTLACENYDDPSCQNVELIEGGYFLNQWIVEINGTEETAHAVAQELGFTYTKPIAGHEKHHFFSHETVPRRHLKKHKDKLNRLLSHRDVERADQQYVYRPTLSQLENYEEFVGYEEPREIQTSTLSHEEREKYYEEFQNMNHEPRFTIRDTSMDIKLAKNTKKKLKNPSDYSSLKDSVKFDEIYREKRQRRKMVENSLYNG